jgi:hypothetical protein
MNDSQYSIRPGGWIRFNKSFPNFNIVAGNEYEVLNVDTDYVKISLPQARSGYGMLLKSSIGFGKTAEMVVDCAEEQDFITSADSIL